MRKATPIVVAWSSLPIDLLHEGDVRLLANGWVELPTGRLLSPEAVHHIDRKSEEPTHERT
ncbi:hypothetical protein [Halalkaliarchaeum sp. AArc-CO]|uniref:hypothetical protein n=1 Tax=Halalkaliarchaeum sp. AArc-CO TaxID=2866381 RepID=UPI0031F32FB7